MKKNKLLDSPFAVIFCNLAIFLLIYFVVMSDYAISLGILAVVIIGILVVNRWNLITVLNQHAGL